MTLDTAAESYLRESNAWESDRIASVRKLARLASISAIAGWVCAVAALIALAVLAPMKSVQPYVIRVDNSTGIVDVVPVYAGHSPIAESVTRYLLSHYVQTCERFNYATAESDYEECGAFHTAQRNQLWASAWNPANPQSPLNLYKDGTTVRIEITSVSFFTRATGINDLAQVRYVKATRRSGGAEETYSHHIATVQYVYATAPAEPRLRRWNPLGFKILDFRTEQEVATGADAKPHTDPRSLRP